MDNVLISIFICSCNYGIIMIKDGIGGSLDFRIQCFLFNCIKIYFSQNEKKLRPTLLGYVMPMVSDLVCFIKTF